MRRHKSELTRSQLIRETLGGVEVVTSLRPIAEDDQANAP